jgi:hypothetical protein
LVALDTPESASHRTSLLQKAEQVALLRTNIPVKTPDKSIRGEKPNGAGQKPIDDTSQEAVAEEEDAGDETLDVQASGKVPDAVDEYPDGAASPYEEALPPPLMVLWQTQSVCMTKMGDEERGGGQRLTSEDSWIYVATMVTSLTVMIRMALTTLKKPKT